MGVEIERKFLVEGDGWRAGIVRERRFRQAYLAVSERASVRVRLDDAGGASLTIKSAAAGLVRAEFDYPVPAADAEAMLALAGGASIDKRRFDVIAAGRRWEVDVFAGRHAGLVIAEIELAAADEALALPDWLGREVTGDGAYTNAALSRAAALPVQ
jgi:adenylate cyclase